MQVSIKPSLSTGRCSKVAVNGDQSDKLLYFRLNISAQPYLPSVLTQLNL